MNRRIALMLSAQSFLCLSACHSAASNPAPSPAADPVALAARSDADGGDPSLISRSQGGAGAGRTARAEDGETEPTLAIAPDGRIAVAWMSVGAGDDPDAATDKGAGQRAIGLRFSSDGGTTWTPEQSIRSPEDRTATDPVLAADMKGNIYLAWLATGPDGAGGVPDTHVFVARADAPGSALGPAVDVSDRMHRGAKITRPGLVTTTNGAVVATWAYGSSLGDGLGFARSIDGKVWTKGSVIERIGLRASLPRACSSAHGDRIWVTYLDSEAGVRVRASDDGGISWSAGRGATVSTAEERPRLGLDGPVCTGDAEQVTIAYGLAHDAKTPNLDAIVVAKSYDGGRVFDSRRVLESSAASATSMLHPQLVREYDGALDLAYYAVGTSTPAAAGALRWTRVEGDRSPLTAGHVARPNVRFEPTRGKRSWPGDYFGWAWQAGVLYAASTDNAVDPPRIAFTRIVIK